MFDNFLYTTKNSMKKADGWYVEFLDSGAATEPNAIISCISVISWAFWTRFFAICSSPESDHETINPIMKKWMGGGGGGVEKY